MNAKNGKKSRLTLWRFISESKSDLVILTIGGTLFNIGLVFIPIFEGWLVGCLYDIIGGSKVFLDMVRLVAAYLAVMLLVQVTRYLKRFYARRITNKMTARLRRSLYRKIVTTEKDGSSDSAGELATRAVQDVDTVADGVRKCLSEIFDTGVLLISYGVTMLILDVRLALIALAFMPIAIIAARLMKTVVYRAVTVYKKSSERLFDATYDRINFALTYRVNAREEAKNAEYDERLADLEKKAVRANVWENTLQPVYNVIAMSAIIIIMILGGRNFLGVGTAVWDVAAYTTFIACYTKIADKISKVAKLVNSVQRAEVSWGRLKGELMEDEDIPNERAIVSDAPVEVRADGLSFGYGGETVFSGLSFTARSGEIVGITGAVASGKSTLLRAFINEAEYGGSLTLNGKELREIPYGELCREVVFLGHNPELFSESVAENVKLGADIDADEALKTVRLDREIAEMPNGADTFVGNGGVRLSGGQQARVGLARTLAHAKSIIVLDDPFSAVDKRTEGEILEEIRAKFSDRLIIIASHRLTEFPKFDKVIWIENGLARASTHSLLISSSPSYAELFRLQTEAGNE